MVLPLDRSGLARALLHHQKTGVPALHQTLLDQDYAMAESLVAAGADLSALIQPPLRQSEGIDPTKRPADRIVLHGTPPLSDAIYLSRHTGPKSELSNENVIDFVLHLKSKAPEENLHFVGANAITLCLLAEVPFPMLKTVIAAAQRQNPRLIDMPDALGRTPCGIAAAQGDTNVLKLLIQHGADVNARDGQGHTPFDHAIDQQHFQAAKVLIENGVGDPKNTAWKEVGAFFSLGCKTHPILRALLVHRDIAGLLAYQKISDQHRVTLFKSLIAYCKEVLDTGSAQDLSLLLKFAQPLLNPMRVAKIAVAVARRPSKLADVTMVLQYLGKEPFPKTRLAALRVAAGKSRSAEMLSLAISIDPTLSELLASSSKPSRAQRAKLNHLLALAMQTNSVALIGQLEKLGAEINLNDRALADLPMIAILADFGDVWELSRRVHAHAIKSGKRVYELLYQSISSIQTGVGLLTMAAAFKSALEPSHMHQMLIHAVKLHDSNTVQALVRVGADLNFLSNKTLGGIFVDAGEPTPVSVAIQTGQIDMLKKLHELGATIRYSDIQRASRVSREIELYVEQLHERT